MNQPAARTGGAAPEILRLTDDRASISGSMSDVNRVIGELRRRGQLAKVTDPQPNSTGGVLVTVRLPREVALPSPKTKRRMRWTRNWVLAITGTVVAVLALCGLALHAAFLWTAAHVAVIGGVMLGAAVLVVALIAVNAVTGGRIVEVFVRVKVK